VIQAEDEIAAIGMVLGASWVGARAFTSTSGPGVSLMSEFIGLGYYAEIPAVIVDVQRVGPSTGLPTRTMQGDLLLCYYNSHGDTRHPLLFPCSPEECFDMAHDALDLAEQLQTPVFVLTDLDLGMNNWMADPFAYPDKPLNRGKVLNAEQLNELKEGWGRYKDVDGDGIPYRSLPATNSPYGAFFTRGSGHNERAVYTERPQDYVDNVDRLSRKFETARHMVPKPEFQERGSKHGLLAFGTSHWGTVEARDRMERDLGISLDYCRLRSLPLCDELRDWIARHDRIYVVEQNRDAQLRTILRDELPEYATRFVSVRQYNGLPLDATTVIDGVVNDAEIASAKSPAGSLKAVSGDAAEIASAKSPATRSADSPANGNKESNP